MCTPSTGRLSVEQPRQPLGEVLLKHFHSQVQHALGGVQRQRQAQVPRHRRRFARLALGGLREQRDGLPKEAGMDLASGPLDRQAVPTRERAGNADAVSHNQQGRGFARTRRQSVRLPRPQYSVTRQGGLVTVPMSCTQLGCRRLNMMSACMEGKG